MRRRRRNVQYMKSVNGQFTINYQAIGSTVDVVIQHVEYKLLKWENGQVVKPRRYRVGGRWPKGYSMSAELTVTYAGGDCLLTVYARNVMTRLNPYLATLAEQGVEVGQCMTRISCVQDGKSNLLLFQ